MSPPVLSFISIRRALYLAMVAVLLPAGQGIAQDKSPDSNAPLASVKSIDALGPTHGEGNGRQVMLRGVVTLVDSKRESFKLHDGERSIGVGLPDGAVCPNVGDTVEVSGRTGALNVQAYSYPHVRGETVKITGTAKLPEPAPVSVASLIAFEHYNQWVSAEGVVLMWTFKKSKLSLLVLGANNALAVMHVQNVNESEIPRNLYGARLRLTGVNMGKSHSFEDTLIVPAPRQMEILTPGTTDIFDAPPISMADAAAQKGPMLARVKVKGTVTAKIGERVIYVRDGKAAICAQLVSGWIRSAGSGQIYGDAGPLPTIKAGDEVELIGSRQEQSNGMPGTAFSLVFCHARVVGSQPVPMPVAANIGEIAAGAFTHDLVHVRGRLVKIIEVPVPRNEWRTTMTLESDDGVQLPAVYQSKEAGAVRSLKTDDEVLVTGLVDNAVAGDPRQLWLTSPGSVQSLGLSPVVRTHQMQVWGGAALLVLTLLVGWIVGLRRSLRTNAVAEAAVRDANANLENRVAERTAELQAAQSELSRLLEQEREVGELKSRFVTMVSHEFRTPLGIIMSAIELIRHYDERLPLDQRRELHGDIFNSTRLMASLMEQVLVLGRVEAGKFGCKPTPCDLATLVSKITDESLSATNRKCPIVWRAKNSLEGARADESLLRHIFGNLVTNAVKYSPEGSSVEFTAEREGSDVVFQVIDQGIGIPSSEMQRLFEAFHRCSNVGEIPGTGLGLVIVKRCVELHGGSLKIDSEVGRGTTFTVRLPLFAL